MAQRRKLERMPIKPYTPTIQLNAGRQSSLVPGRVEFLDGRSVKGSAEAVRYQQPTFPTAPRKKMITCRGDGWRLGEKSSEPSKCPRAGGETKCRFVLRLAWIPPRIFEESSVDRGEGTLRPGA
jgi:hypothetical protein